MRYYYDDPIKAAWMVREHGLKLPVLQNSGMIRFDKTGNERYYLHEDCHELLKPKVGDYGADGKYSGFVNMVREDGILIELPAYIDWGGGAITGRLIALKDFILEKRDNKAWFNPEVSE